MIDNQISHADRFTYSDSGRITDFGLSPGELDNVIDSGEPFRTSGCEGYNGQVACNRPYANSRPGPGMRNYPFQPNKADILRIRQQLGVSKPI